MNNTTRDRTEEHRDRDDLGNQTIPPPQAPVADGSPHVPGGATEMGELAQIQQPATGGKPDAAKSAEPSKASPTS